MPNIATYEVIDILEQSHFHGDVKFLSATQDVLGGTLIVCDSSGGSFTLTLPEAADYPERLLHFKQVSATNTVTVQRAGSDTIDGATSFGLATQYASKSIISDGTTWHVLNP